LKKSYITIICLFALTISFESIGQRTPCNPDVIFLSSQMDVNNFQLNHGPCDSIVNRLVLNGGDISDLTPLAGLQTVDQLYIVSTTSLTSLSGLENLEVEDLGQLVMRDNSGLSDVSQLMNIGRLGILEFDNNPLLTDLSIIQNVTVVADVIVRDMDALVDLDDFINLDTVLTDFIIRDNDILSDISAFADLRFGYALPAKTFRITGNPLLNDCSAICSVVKLSIPAQENVTTNIQNNLGNCLDQAAVLSNCGRTPCNQDNITLTSSTDINIFQSVYGPCDSITGTLQIGNATFDNTSIDGLSQLSDLEYVGSLLIFKNVNLTNLSGLENLSMSDINVLRINGNSSLTDISQLSGIGTSVNTMIINNNDMITDLTGLDQLTTFNTEFNIVNNDALTGLDKFQAASIVGRTLIIRNNDQLTDISGVSNILDYGTAMNPVFWLDENDMLEDCSPLCYIIQDVLPGLTGLTKSIQNNLSTCLNESVIADECNTLGCANLSGYTGIPDINFEQALIDQGIDSKEILDGCVNTTDINSITLLDLSDRGIVDLSGIEDFEILEELLIPGNSIPSIDLSQNQALLIVKGSY